MKPDTQWRRRASGRQSSIVTVVSQSRPSRISHTALQRFVRAKGRFPTLTWSTATADPTPTPSIHHLREPRPVSCWNNRQMCRRRVRRPTHRDPNGLLRRSTRRPTFARGRRSIRPPGMPRSMAAHGRRVRRSRTATAAGTAGASEEATRSTDSKGGRRRGPASDGVRGSGDEVSGQTNRRIERSGRACRARADPHRVSDERAESWPSALPRFPLRQRPLQQRILNHWPARSIRS
jgi:hypothetical protein